MAAIELVQRGYDGGGYQKYSVLLHGKKFDDIEWNLRGYMGLLPVPPTAENGHKVLGLNIGKDKPLDKFKKEIAKLNKEWARFEKTKKNPHDPSAKFPRWTVLGRRFHDGTEAIWFAKQKALESGDEVPVRQQDDGWSPSFELQVVKPGKAAYDYSKNPPTCKLCGGQKQILGSLGWTRHYRCRDCGAESSQAVRRPKPKKKNNPTRRRAATKRILRAWMKAKSGKGSMALHRKAARRMGLKASMFIRKNGRRK